MKIWVVLLKITDDGFSDDGFSKVYLTKEEIVNQIIDTIDQPAGTEVFVRYCEEALDIEPNS